MDKDNIYNGVSKFGVKEGTKDGLLKGAGFTNSEREAIKKQEVNEGSKKLEDRAVERMNNAVERIVKDFNYLKGILTNNNLTSSEKKDILIQRGISSKEKTIRLYEIIKK